jgi:cell division protein ZapA (FtsZ GTPase activity inhibitor)
MNIRKIKIAGRNLTIRSTGEDTHIDQVVEALNHKITETQRMIPDSTEALLFVALALSDELARAQNRLDLIQSSTQVKINGLLGALEAFENRHTLGG